MITPRVPLTAMGAGLLVLSVLLTGSEVQGSPLFESANQSPLTAPKDQNDKNDNSGKNDNSSKNENAGKNDNSSKNEDRSSSSPGSEKKENQAPGQDKKTTPAAPEAAPSATPTPRGNPAPKGEHNPVGICHNSGDGKRYGFITVDDNSTEYQGHQAHPGDIIPASPELCEQKNQDAKATPTTLPAQAATVTPTPGPTESTATVAATVTAEPTAVVSTPTAVGTPTVVSTEDGGDRNNDGREDEEDSGEGDQGRSSGGVLSSEFQISNGNSAANGAEAGLDPSSHPVTGVVIDPITGEVLAGEPGVPLRRLGQTGLVPSVSQASPGASVAQIPQSAGGSPQVLPNTGDSGSSRYQGWSIAGMVMGALGLSLIRVGRRIEERH